MPYKTLIAHLNLGKSNTQMLRVVAGACDHGRRDEWAFDGTTQDVLRGDRCALLSH